MASGASRADVAVLLIDARKRILTQTRRHTRIAALFGIESVILAINKMDLVDFSEDVFQSIRSEYLEFARACGIQTIVAVPTCAVDGDNVATRSDRMPWFSGPSILEALENWEAANPPASAPFAMPVQWVNRPNQDFRGLCGRIASGEVRPGDRLLAMPSSSAVTVKDVIRLQPGTGPAAGGESITISLHEDVDVSRGDVLCDAAQPALVADQFSAHLLWMHGKDLMPGRPYLLKLHSKEVSASITDIKFREDVGSGAKLAATTLKLNEIGVVNITTSQKIAFQPFGVNRSLGGFILIDKETLATVAAGTITFALRRASNIWPQHLDVNRDARARLNQQRPRVVWFTGLSGAGKSAIANLVEKRLFADGRHTYLLDGDNVRQGLNRDLGFTEADRVENIRRAAEVARLMMDAGLIVLVSFISPFRSDRQMARELFAPGDFVEVFVDTPLEECERRDPKGLYVKARAGGIKNFTGIDSPYERPDHPELHLLTEGRSAEDCAGDVYDFLNAG
jgi:bifunctional enzyme CysN/CysC